MDLIDKTIKGTIWAYGAEIMAKVITPLSFIVLSHILTPDDYGVVAVATTILMFLNILCDLGTSQVIIQAPDEDKNWFYNICNSGFWLNAILGLSLFLLVEFFAPLIADYYNQPDSTLVIRVMAIQILFTSLSSIQNSLKRKDLNFKYLFNLRVITVFVPIFVAIPIAFLGGSYWAIVLSSVISSFLQTICLWYNSSWRPKIKIELQYFRCLFSKSIWNTFNQLFIWIPISLDTYFISKYLNPADLGLYTTSRTLFSSFSGLILAPIAPVIFSSLSKIHQLKEFINLTYKSQKILFSVSAISSLGVFMFAEYVTLIIFNDKWIGITPIIQIIFLIMGYEYFGSVIYEAVRAKGWFKQMSFIYLISIIITIPLLYWGAISADIKIYTIIRTLTLYIPMLGIFILAHRIGISFKTCITNNNFVILGSLIIIPFVLYLNYIDDYYITGICKILIYLLFSAIFIKKNRHIFNSIKSRIKIQFPFRFNKNTNE